jgi:hypothetical protein
MSNVLIGIIGVILFIGLALAGALFLGPRFQEATIDSRASSISMMLSQSVDAMHMYTVQEGDTVVVGGFQSLIDKGYLKDRPVGSYVRDSEGANTTVKSTMITITSRGDPTVGQDSLCATFAKRVGMQSSTEVTVADVIPTTKRVGCIRNSAVIGLEPVGTHIFFERI